MLLIVAPFGLSASRNGESVKKVLFIGDSMTGWLAERMNAYGQKNDFEVATIVWDGSTIRKWAESPKLAKIIEQQKPDVIFVSLGMNELLEKNPKVRLASEISKLKKAFGNIPVIWVGPPSWPGKGSGENLISFIKEEMGEKHFFDSSELSLARQSKSNPHPTRAGMIKWMDSVMEWIPEHTSIEFKSLNKPEGTQMNRGNVFIYKRMKETL